MRVGITGAATAAMTLVAALFAATSDAAPTDHSLNGVYQATSNGEWAKTRDVYMDEPTVRSTWTIASSCRTPLECIGQVTSDQGWTAAIRMGSGEVWRVDRILDNWERCEDGTAFPGHQIYTFWPVDDSGLIRPGSPVLGGKDRTVGPSGACGVNQWLTLEMPFKLVKIG